MFCVVQYNVQEKVSYPQRTSFKFHCSQWGIQFDVKRIQLQYCLFICSTAVQQSHPTENINARLSILVSSISWNDINRNHSNFPGVQICFYHLFLPDHHFLPDMPSMLLVGQFSAQTSCVWYTCPTLASLSLVQKCSLWLLNISLSRLSSSSSGGHAPFLYFKCISVCLNTQSYCKPFSPFFYCPHSYFMWLT